MIIAAASGHAGERARTYPQAPDGGTRPAAFRLSTLTGTALRSSDRAAADQGEPAIALWPAPPPPIEVQRQLLEWRRGYESFMAPVDESWNAVLESLHHDRAWHLKARCARLAGEMERLDFNRLTPAPDPVVDLHLRSLLDHLFAAARVCSRERFFETEYRLTEAADARKRLAVMLRRRLRSGASAPDPYNHRPVN